MSSAGHASEAIVSRLYLANKTTYSRPLCNLQYHGTDAAKLTRISGVRSLVSEWQGRELVKSAAYPLLSENDQVQLANRKVAITLLFLQIDVWKYYSKGNRVRQVQICGQNRNRK